MWSSTKTCRITSYAPNYAYRFMRRAKTPVLALDALLQLMGMQPEAGALYIEDDQPVVYEMVGYQKAFYAGTQWHADVFLQP